MLRNCKYGEKVQVAVGWVWTRTRPTQHNGWKITGNYLYKIRCE